MGCDVVICQGPGPGPEEGGGGGGRADLEVWFGDSGFVPQV